MLTARAVSGLTGGAGLTIFFGFGGANDSRCYDIAVDESHRVMMVGYDRVSASTGRNFAYARVGTNALLDPATKGQVYELAGPDVLTLGQIVTLAGTYCGHPRPVIKLPAPLARLQAMLLEWAPGGPLMSRDNLDSMQVANVIAPSSTALTLADLGIVSAALAAVAPRYLGSVHRGRDRFDDFRSRAKR